MRKLFFAILLFSFPSLLQAQANVRDSSLSVSLLLFSGGFHSPTQDFAKRFGGFTQIGLSYLRKTSTGILLGADAHFVFGNKVHETRMVDAVTVSDGFAIGADGTLYDVKFFLRGFKTELRVGKLWSIKSLNPNSGVYSTLGVGVLQHKIRIDGGRNSDIPQLNKAYVKGYDRLSNGLCITPAIGYLNLSNNRRVNFFAQLEYTVAFTENRRSWNFDQNGVDLVKRVDGMIGIKVGWIIPLFKKKADDYYFF